jgi:D-lactate dehydrogenase
VKIVAFEVEDWEKDHFQQLDGGHEVVTTAAPLDEETAAQHADAEVVTTFIYSQLDRGVLEKLPELKLIATRSTGVDHIDRDYCGEHDIVVANVPAYGDNTVAEHVFALLLAISHRLIDAVDRTRRGDFTQGGLQGFDLEGKTIGVVGTGRIGLHAARIARGFGMNVLAYDIEQNEQAACDIGFRYVDLPDLLAGSDVVTLHVPGTETTKHMIGADQFGQMKEGAVLINTARGPVVDVQAMVKALADGRLSAAGLDVLPEEPVIREEAELLRSAFSKEHNLEALLADNILMRVRRVIVTPHNAFNTREAVQRIMDTTRENIESFLRGDPQNVAD